MKELVTCYKIPIAIQKLYVLNDNARLKFIIFDIIVLNSSTLSIRISHCIYACVRANPEPLVRNIVLTFLSSMSVRLSKSSIYITRCSTILPHDYNPVTVVRSRNSALGYPEVTSG